jgi:hypothetical protein
MAQAQNSPKLSCRAGPVLKELSDLEGWRALEEYGKRWSVWHAARIFISQWREQTQRRDDSNTEKRQNREPIRATSGMSVRNQQTNKRESDCDCRNQEPSPPLPILNHRGASLICKYIGSRSGPSSQYFAPPRTMETEA